MGGGGGQRKNNLALDIFVSSGLRYIESAIINNVLYVLHRKQCYTADDIEIHHRTKQDSSKGPDPQNQGWIPPG